MSLVNFTYDIMKYEFSFSKIINNNNKLYHNKNFNPFYFKQQQFSLKIPTLIVIKFNFFSYK